MKRWVVSLVPVALWAQPAIDPSKSGGATVVHTGNTSLVSTNSPLTIAEWHSFNLNGNEVCHFSLPTSGSLFVSRITGGAIAQIDGTIWSNQGTLWFINTDGFLIGESAHINCNSLLFSTFDTSNQEIQDFYSHQTDQIHFQGNGAASIRNLGQITAIDGDLILLAHQIDNGETASLHAGKSALLGAGSGFYLYTTQEPRISIATNILASPASTGINNQGKIEALQNVLLSEGSLYALAINHEESGTLRVASCSSEEGTVRLIAEGGRVQIGGAIVSNCSSENSLISINSEEIVIGEQAKLHLGEVTLGQRGGTIQIGSEEGCSSIHIAEGALFIVEGEEQGGKIELLAKEGIYEKGGQFRANGTSPTSTGGEIRVIGTHPGVRVECEGHYETLGHTFGSTLIGTLGHLYLGEQESASNLSNALVSTIFEKMLRQSMASTNLYIEAGGLNGAILTGHAMDFTESSTSGAPVSFVNLQLTAEDRILVQHALKLEGRDASSSLECRSGQIHVGINDRISSLDLVKGNLTINAQETLSITGGNQPNIYSRISIDEGNTTIHAGNIQIFGGDKVGAFSLLKQGEGDLAIWLLGDLVVKADVAPASIESGSLLSINSLEPASIQVEAANCASAAILVADGGKLHIGQDPESQIQSIMLQGGCCGTQGLAQIGSSGSAEVLSSIHGDYRINGADEGFRNSAGFLIGPGLLPQRLELKGANLYLKAGEGNVNSSGDNRAFIENHSPGGSVILSLTDSLSLLGGGGIGSSAKVAGSIIHIETGGDISLTGGDAVNSSASIEADSSVELLPQGNMTLTGGSTSDSEAKISLEHDGILSIQMGAGKELLVQGGSGEMASSAGFHMGGDTTFRILGSPRISFSGTQGNGLAKISILGRGSVFVEAGDLTLEGGQSIDAPASWSLGIGGESTIQAEKLSLYGRDSSASIEALGDMDLNLNVQGLTQLIGQGGGATIGVENGALLLSSQDCSLLGGDIGTAQIFSQQGPLVAIRIAKDFAMSATGVVASAEILSHCPILLDVGGDLSIHGVARPEGNSVTIRSLGTIGAIDLNIEGQAHFDGMSLILGEESLGLFSLRGGREIRLTNGTRMINHTSFRPIRFSVDDCTLGGFSIDQSSLVSTNQSVIHLSTPFLQGARLEGLDGSFCVGFILEEEGPVRFSDFNELGVLFELFYRTRYYRPLTPYSLVDFTEQHNWVAP